MWNKIIHSQTPHYHTINILLINFGISCLFSILLRLFNFLCMCCASVAFRTMTDVHNYHDFNCSMRDSRLYKIPQYVKLLIFLGCSNYVIIKVFSRLLCGTYSKQNGSDFLVLGGMSCWEYPLHMYKSLYLKAYHINLWLGNFWFCNARTAIPVIS